MGWEQCNDGNFFIISPSDENPSLVLAIESQIQFYRENVNHENILSNEKRSEHPPTVTGQTWKVLPSDARVHNCSSR